MKENIFPEKEDALDSPGFLFWKISNEWQKRVNKCLSNFNLTHTQFVLIAGIRYLSERGKEVSQKNLADHASTDQMTTSTVVRTLIQKKYVDRKSSETDTRMKLLSLTNLGMKILKKSIKEVQEIDEIIFSIPGKEQAKWMQLLKRIYQNNCV